VCVCVWVERYEERLEDEKVKCCSSHHMLFNISVMERVVCDLAWEMRVGRRSSSPKKHQITYTQITIQATPFSIHIDDTIRITRSDLNMLLCMCIVVKTEKEWIDGEDRKRQQTIMEFVRHCKSFTWLDCGYLNCGEKTFWRKDDNHYKTQCVIIVYNILVVISVCLCLSFYVSHTLRSFYHKHWFPVSEVHMLCAFCIKSMKKALVPSFWFA
jgi:hypothetical protein